MLALVAAGWPDGLAAGEPEEFDDFADLQLTELLDTVVSSARHEQDLAEAASAVTLITREQLENTGCTDLICLLRQVPEVDVFDTAPVFVGTGARAMSELLGDRVVVLLDGREINNDFYGFPLFQALPVHLDDIERVEVVRGPGSALYGANAYSMVISITSRSRAVPGEVFAGSGEWGRTCLHARLGTEIAGWELLASGGMEQGSYPKWRDRPGRDVVRTRLQANRETAAGQTLLQAGLITLEGDFFADLAPLLVHQGFQAFLLASHRNDWLQARLTADVMRGLYTLDLPLYYQGMKLGEAPAEMAALNTGLDGELILSHSFLPGNLLLGGLNYRWITLVAEANQPEWVNQHRFGVFFQGEQRLFDRLTLTAGGRLDVNTITPMTFSPRAAAVLKLSTDQFLRLSFGMAFRKPTLFNTSLHMKGFRGEPGFETLGEFFQRSIGNSNLGNEGLTSLELGYNLRLLDRKLRAEVVAFYLQNRDPISSHLEIRLRNGLPDLATSVLMYDNSGRETDSAGGSITLALRLSRELRAEASYMLRSSWYINDAANPADATAAIGRGGRMPFEAAHLFKASGHYVAGNGLCGGMDLFARSASSGDANQNGSPFEPRITLPLPAVLLLNAYLAWRLELPEGLLEIGLRVTNLLDVPFRDVPVEVRTDGTEMGGQLLTRQMFFYLRGTGEEPGKEEAR